MLKSNSSKVISKDTITRLLKDVKHIIKNPLNENGIYYIHDDVDMLKGYALLIGPEETPYFGGYYFFQFDFPTDYPYSPPKLTFLTNSRDVRFNPNLYKCGKVCVSILNTWHGDQWSACQTISTVLLTLITLLCKNPLLNEPGINVYHSDFKNYTEIVEYANVDIAVCDILEKKVGVYLPQPMDLFTNIVKEHFIKNYEKLMQFTEKKSSEVGGGKGFFVLTTNLYLMKIRIDYSHTIQRLKECLVEVQKNQKEKENNSEKIESS